MLQLPTLMLLIAIAILGMEIPTAQVEHTLTKQQIVMDVTLQQH